VKGDVRGVRAPEGVFSASCGSDSDPVIADALRAALEKKRDEIVGKWLTQTLDNFPDLTSRFFRHEKDRFRNPVGHALKEGLPLLVDQAIGDMDDSRIAPALDSIVKIRAVQEFTAAQAVAFLFQLKQVFRDVVPEQILHDPGGLNPIDLRIDRMALLAFDLYVQCREKMQELKVNEMRRRMYLMERMQAGSQRRDSETGPENGVP
jgi:hypothetical protein